MRKNRYIVILFIAIVLTITGCGRRTPSSTSKLEINSSKDNATATPTKAVATPTVEEIKYEITDSRFDYYTNSIGDIEYYGIVEITNTGNSNLYLADATFDLEDNNGHLLQSDDFISKAPAVVKPGKTGYFYNGLGSCRIDKNVSLDNGVKLVPQITVKKADRESKRYEVVDQSFREGTFGSPTTTGRVVNDSSEESGIVYVTIVFADSNDKVLAITDTTVTDIPANGTKSFECSPLLWNENISFNDLQRYRIIAEEMYLQF